MIPMILSPRPDQGFMMCVEMMGAARVDPLNWSESDVQSCEWLIGGDT